MTSPGSAFSAAHAGGHKTLAWENKNIGMLTGRLSLQAHRFFSSLPLHSTSKLRDPLENSRYFCALPRAPRSWPFFFYPMEKSAEDFFFKC